MNNRTVVAFLGILCMLNYNVDAAIPGKTIIIGDKAYDIKYLFDGNNCEKLKADLLEMGIGFDEENQTVNLDNYAQSVDLYTYKSNIYYKLIDNFIGDEDFGWKTWLNEDVNPQIIKSLPEITYFTDWKVEEYDANNGTVLNSTYILAKPKIITKPQTINAESIVIEGKACPNSTVTIDGGCGDVAIGKADSNANYAIKVMLNRNEVNTLNVTSTDDDGNISDATTIEIVEDSEIPDAPIVSTDTQTVDLDKITIKGTAEALSKITIEGGLGKPTIGNADENGEYSLDVPLKQNAINDLSVTATDAAENVSEATNLEIIEASGIDKPTITTAKQETNSDVITITGMTQPLSQVTITGGLEESIIGDTDEDGNFAIDVTLTPNTLNELKVTAKDSIGNISEAATVDITQDNIIMTPTILTQSQTVNVEKIRIQGTAEPNSTVTIDGGFGDVATGVADLNGKYSIDVMLNRDMINTLSVTSTDEAGNISDAETVDIVEDSTPPDEPIVWTPSQTVNLDKITITGIAEALSIINITGGLFDSVSTKADYDGDYSIDVPLVQDAINKLKVTATDSVGNMSDITTITITEDSSIVKPTITTLAQVTNDDSITIVGKTEPFSDVTITGGLDDLETGKADDDGDYSIVVSLKQNTINKLKVIAKDSVGNISEVATVDITQDNIITTPTIATLSQTINAEKIRIQGTAEPKSTVTIDGGAGDAAKGLADLNGNYDIEVVLNKDTTNTLSVTSTDEAGNVSEAATVDITEDSTPPDAPIISTEPQSVNLDKIKITGTAEPLSEIAICGGLNKVVIGNTDENGDYCIDVSLKQNEVNTLEVTAKDTLGNVSEPSTVDITEDSVINIPTITTQEQIINSDIITITGNTEPLAEVTITGELENSAIGNADENGDYSIDISLKQDSVNMLKVKAKDIAGNTSSDATLKIIEDSSTIKPTIVRLKQKVIDNKISLRGKAEPNATITIEGCVDEPVTGVVDSEGNYDVNVEINPDETKRLKVTATDELGNVSDVAILDLVEIIRGILAPDKLNIYFG